MHLLNSNVMQYVTDFSGYEGAQFSSDWALKATFLRCPGIYKILLHYVKSYDIDMRYFFLGFKKKKKKQNDNLSDIFHWNILRSATPAQLYTVPEIGNCYD